MERKKKKWRGIDVFVCVCLCVLGSGLGFVCECGERASIEKKHRRRKNIIIIM